VTDVARLASNGTVPGRRVHFRCPGCDDVHGVTVDAGPVVWSWNGDLERPTFSPSILVQGNQWPKDEYPEYYKAAHPRVAPGDDTICHSFVTDGRIQFLGDCTHALAGQTVDLPPWREDES
jgi:hypothetical protein